jgi:hypothetical protein
VARLKQNAVMVNDADDCDGYVEQARRGRGDTVEDPIGGRIEYIVATDGGKPLALGHCTLLQLGEWDALR